MRIFLTRYHGLQAQRGHSAVQHCREKGFSLLGRTGSEGTLTFAQVNLNLSPIIGRNLGRCLEILGADCKAGHIAKPAIIQSDPPSSGFGLLRRRTSRLTSRYFAKHSNMLYSLKFMWQNIYLSGMLPRPSLRQRTPGAASHVGTSLPLRDGRVDLHFADL